MSTALWVLTSPRPGGVSYLDGTLEQLEQAGAAECAQRLVYSDGRLEVPCRWPSFVNLEGPSGSRRAFWAMFKHAAEISPEADRFLFFEDDIVLVPNAVTSLLSLEVEPEVGLISGFNSRFNFGRGAFPDSGLVHTRALGPDERGFWGSLAILVPRRTLEYFNAHDPLAVEVGARELMPHGSADVIMSLLLEASAWPLIGYAHPPLVGHRGEISTASEHGHGAGRVGVGFGE